MVGRVVMRQEMPETAEERESRLARRDGDRTRRAAPSGEQRQCILQERREGRHNFELSFSACACMLASTNVTK